MQKGRWITIFVGLLVVFSAIGLFFLAFMSSQIGGFRAGEVYTVKTRFDDISGLSKQARVSMSGVQIGRISNIVLDNDTSEVEVTLTIKKDVTIPTDSVAKILTSGLLGERYIGIVRGTSQKLLGDGDTITRTGSAFVLEKVLQQIIPSKENIYSDNTYTVIANFSDVSGLRVGAPVMLSGVSIGRVKTITLDKASYQAQVSLEIDTQYDALPIDSSADILSASILGGKYIGITLGGDTIMLKDGDVMQYTSSAIVLEKLIQQFISNAVNSK